jgi:capsular polysaccharide transport system ATP-binding protein
LQQKIPIVHASGVTKLGTRHAVSHSSVSIIFNEMTVTLPTDQVCAVLGRPGSGRTTFLRMLSGAERPDSGAIFSEVRFSVIGNGGTFFHPGLSGEENITLAGRLHGMDAAMLIELTLGLSKFGALWQLPAGSVPGPRRRAMEMLVAAVLPFDCYLVDDVERVDSDTFELVLEILRLRKAGIIFTAHNPRFVRQFATVGSVIANHTIYAFPSVDEALKHYA